MTQLFLPGLFDRLIGDRPCTVSDSGMAELTLDQLKDAVAADLQALLNTRAAYPEGLLDAYPECQKVDTELWPGRFFRDVPHEQR